MSIKANYQLIFLAKRIVSCNPQNLVMLQAGAIIVTVSANYGIEENLLQSKHLTFRSKWQPSISRNQESMFTPDTQLIATPISYDQN